VTSVSGAHHVDRGYDRFELQLQRLGADVIREPDDDLYP
jgi:UDP-N-acetylglucosamine 1-carboxyvinyltransferase